MATLQCHNLDMVSRHLNFPWVESLKVIVNVFEILKSLTWYGPVWEGT